MKSNLRLFSIIAFLFIFITSATIFYAREDSIKYEQEEDQTYLEDSQAIKLVKDYEQDRNYYVKTVKTYKCTKSLFPFYYNKEVIKDKNMGIFSEK